MALSTPDCNRSFSPTGALQARYLSMVSELVDVLVSDQVVLPNPSVNWLWRQSREQVVMLNPSAIRL